MRAQYEDDEMMSIVVRREKSPKNVGWPKKTAGFGDIVTIMVDGALDH